MRVDKSFAQVIGEDLVDNLFMGLAIAYFIEGKQPTTYKVAVIVLVTLFYWFVVHRLFILFSNTFLK